jgi:cobalt-zinc-cadmium efflux system outer membrane protein
MKLPLVYILVIGTAVSRASAESINLGLALNEAAEKNLNLLAERYNLTIADARVLQAGLRPNPVFTYGQDYQNVFGTGITAQNSGGPPEFNTRVDFILERGGKRQSRIELAKAQRSVAELNLVNAMRGLNLDVANAYVDALAARDSLGLARENLKSLQDVVEINQARVQAGDLAEVELTRTRLAAMQFETTVRQAELRLRTAITKLLLLMGRNPSPDGIEIAGELRSERLALPLGEIRAEALRNRPDLLALSRDQARSQADIRLQIAQGKVDFDIGTIFHYQYGYSNAQSMGFFFSTPLPIFNRNQGEVARAQRESLQAVARVEALRAQIENEVQVAYEQYVTSQNQVDRIERDMLKQAKDVRDTTEYSYRRGEASFVEFLDAQRAYNDTMQSYYDARADFARNLYLIDSVTARGINP